MQVSPASLPATYTLTCTGAGGSGIGSVTVAANAPMAVINTTDNVFSYYPVVLDGSESGDAAASLQSYRWVQTSGPTVTLTGANSQQATFTAPQVTSQTQLGFSLTVTDTTGAASTSSAMINVNPPTSAQLTVAIAFIQMLETAPPNPHTAVAPADGPSLAGSSAQIEVDIVGPAGSPAFSLIDANGNVLSTPTFVVADNPSLPPVKYYGSITVPSVPFTVAISGTSSAGNAYAVKSSTLLAPMNMSIEFSPSWLWLTPGTSATSQLTIYNGGPAATFVVQFSDPKSLLSSEQTVSVPVAASSSATVPISLTLPIALTSAGAPTVTATASVSGDSTRSGAATLTVWPTGAP
jgi:hypothetical protein